MIKMPQYITPEEVLRVCRALGIRNWAVISSPIVHSAEAKKILREINVQAMPIALKDFKLGLEVELEHGTRFKDANVTYNHPILTGMIVLAHLKETLDYYQRLDVAETEGDLLKAIVAGNAKKVRREYKKLRDARRALNAAEARQLR